MGELKTGRLSEKPRYVKKGILIQVAMLIVIRGFIKLSFHMLQIERKHVKKDTV